MRELLSLCMIVKNEERDLPRCLDSVRALAGEFILVDTGSTDATLTIAAGYGAEIIPYDFTVVDFAAARNHAIAHASGRWILMLDADETLDCSSGPEVHRLVTLDEDAGYFVERRNHDQDSVNFLTDRVVTDRVVTDRVVTDYVVRLFPNRQDYRFRGRVHETIDASILAGGGRLHETKIRIDHNFAPDPEARAAKNQWYVKILKEEIEANPWDCSRLEFLAAEYHQLRMFDEAVAVTERLARIRPRDPTARLHLGVYRLLYQADPARARTEFQAALRLRPQMAEAESFLKMC